MTLRTDMKKGTRISRQSTPPRQEEGALIFAGSLESSGHFRLEGTKRGVPTLLTTREDGTQAYLHSRYDPLSEAKRQMAEVKVGSLDTVVLLGMGLGYCVECLIEKLSEGNSLIVVEREKEAFEAACKRPSFQSVLKRKRTYFFVATESDALYDFLISHVSAFLASGFRLIRHGPSFTAFPSYYGDFLRRIQDFVRTGGVTVRTAMYLSRISFSNRMKNLKAYVSSPGIEPLRNRFLGKPGVVVSAGPSLARNIELLREVKSRAPIVAVSTAVKALFGKGISPDFAVIIDYASLSRRYFEDIPGADQIPLICDLKANSEAIAVYKGPKLFCDDLLINTILGEAFYPKGQIASGSTVAHAAFNFACFLGCNPIIFVGQDLAYTDGELHVPGTAVYQQSLAEFNRFFSPAMKELQYALTMRPRLREVTAWDGKGKVRTCEIFSTYLEEFEQFFRRCGRKVVDCTEGGALKRFCERMKLSEAIKRFMPGRLPPEFFSVPSLSAEEVEKRLELTRKTLRRLIEESLQLASLYDSAISLIRKVIKENRQGRAADDIVLKVLKIKEKLRQYGKLYLVTSHLAQGDVYLRIRKDREIETFAGKGVERQKRQAERDLEYLLGLKNALDFFRSELEKCTIL